MTPRTVVCRLPGRRRGRGQRSFPQAASAAPLPSVPRGRVPRVSRLLALAHRLDELVRTGVVSDHAGAHQVIHAKGQGQQTAHAWHAAPGHQR